MSNTKTVETLHVCNLNDFIEPNMETNVVNGNMTFKLFYEIFAIPHTARQADVEGFFCKSLAERVRNLHKYHVRDNGAKYLANEREIECAAVEKFATEMQIMGECNPRAMVVMVSRYCVENKL